MGVVSYGVSETIRRSEDGTTLDYGSETGNTFLRHMREDQTLQAILRFGRDKEGAVVKAFSAGTKAVVRVAKTNRGRSFN